MEPMTDGTKMNVQDLIQIIGALYVENIALKAKINLLMDKQNNETKSK